jgi:ATP-dependent protease ClpP protease subunit
MNYIEDINFHYIVNEDGEKIISNNLAIIRVVDFDEISYTMFQEGFTRSINSKAGFIPVEIDSYGGEVHILLGMLGFLDSMRSQKIISTFTATKAMSCGAVLLSAGTPGYRFMSPTAHVMIHEVSRMEWGKFSEVKRGVRHQEDLNETIFQQLDKNCGKDPGYFKRLVKDNDNADLYLSAKQCLEHGIIDKICIPTVKLSVNPSYELLF